MATSTFLIVNGDVVVNPATGRLVLVADNAKLRQDVGETLRTSKQSDGTGSSVEDVMGLVADPTSVKNALTRRAANGLQALQAVQQSIQPGDRSDAETLSSISLLKASQAKLALSGPGAVSKTRYVLQIGVTSVAGEPVTVTTVI